MSEEPVTYKPRMLQYTLLFAVLMMWGFACIKIASYILAALYTEQLLWFVFATAILLPLPFPLWASSRMLKQRVSYEEVVWDFQTQELDFDTYSKMMADYASGYSHLIVRQDRRMLVLALLIMAVSILLPAPLVLVSLSLIFYLPYVFGALALVYGILLSIYFYRASPNEASPYFLFENPRTLQRALKLLESTPGLTWIGVRFQMSKVGGYFAFRSPSAVGRIVGIEAVARVEIAVGGLDPPMTAFGIVSSIEGEDARRMMELSSPGEEVNQLADLVRWCIALYVRNHGSNEILDEVLDDLGIAKPESRQPID